MNNKDPHLRLHQMEVRNGHLSGCRFHPMTYSPCKVINRKERPDRTLAFSSLERDQVIFEVLIQLFDLKEASISTEIENSVTFLKHWTHCGYEMMIVDDVKIGVIETKLYEEVITIQFIPDDAMWVVTKSHTKEVAV